MVHGLETPPHLAGDRIKGHHRGGIELAEPRAVRSPIVGRCIAGRQIDQAKLGIKGRGRPDIGRAARIGLALRRQLADGRIAQIPSPRQLARHRIKGPHDARRLGQFLIVRHPATKNHLIANHGRHGGLEIEAGLDRSDTGREVNLAALAKAGAKRARIGI